MRLRVEEMSLVGTTREVVFGPGLNVVVGPIATGKSSLMRLLRVLLGGGVPTLTPEVRENVSALAGQLVVGADAVSAVRPLTSTPTAKVDLATASGEALRLPALQTDRTAPQTYGRWLLGRLGLPDLRVAAAPTRPAESATTPVSINDYLTYCELRQDEIDTSVFGSNHPQRDIKRRYVFQILYGLFDAHLATLQEELRDLQARLRVIRGGAESFVEFLGGTAWANRAAIEHERVRAQQRLRELDAELAATAEDARRDPRAQELRDRVQMLDAAVADTRSARAAEQRSHDQLQELVAQLETQTGRLTKSIVAGSRLYDLDFKVCPRCASPLDRGRADPEHCYLCSQRPQAPVSREDLIREQDRIAAQIVETDQLIATRGQVVADLDMRLARLSAEREHASAALDEQMRTFVSEQAEHIARRARERAELEATLRRTTDYLGLFERLDRARAEEGRLEQRKEALEAEAEQAQVIEVRSAERIARLEEHFARLVDAFGTPRFEGEPRAAIDPRTFMPILNGRTFDQLSSGGLKVLANLAYVLAHHLTALDCGLALPGLLLIDGITKNVGRDEYDQARVDAVFNTLLEISDQRGADFQIIVAANDVPRAAEGHVALTLSPNDRLIPAAGN